MCAMRQCANAPMHVHTHRRRPNVPNVPQAKREWREAASDARAALKLDPLFPKAYMHLGKSLLQQGNLDEARAAVQAWGVQ